ncbi:HepT-like ribonuclease domain-containing protein [Parafrankia discariae]|uniref:HepT-like ribonuclease domain-containing protein n=1 Tax=Parafrankia discariae TaxID=365528 RepID=UPI00039B077C|nr:HepT-like ribonuclease domain-containing protein [Parafrankia discariae]
MWRCWNPLAAGGFSARLRFSPEIRGRWPDLPWRSVTGFRDIAIHAYFEVDWSGEPSPRLGRPAASAIP